MAVRGMQILLIAVLAAGLLVTAPTTSHAGQWAPSEYQFVEKINDERAKQGHGSLRINTMLTQVARDWSDQMRRDDRLRHRSDLATAVSGSWTRLGENVGYSQLTGASDAELVERLHRAFMDSSGHRRNIMGDYNQVGVGVRVTSGNKMGVTVNFMKGPINEAQIQHSSPLEGFAAFADVGRSAHAGAIETLYDSGITNGRSRTAFGTNEQVTRGEMASFLTRASELDPRTDTGFGDVATSYTHAGSIGAIVDAEITTGYTDGTFRPRDPVTRAEMASFLVRARSDLRETDGDHGFPDVGATNGHAAAIAAIAEAGITTGYTDGSFGPRRAVTRGEMASFIVRAYQLD